MAPQISAILTDIEGTTSSIDFVKEVLFPYATKSLENYVQTHEHEAHVQAILTQVQQESNLPIDSINAAIEQLHTWIAADEKKTPLKQLQGYIWEHGYQEGHFVAHMYDDAVLCLKDWATRYALAIYSSGSIKAQKLFMAHTDHGDLSDLFSHFYDTTTGPKKEQASYQKIAESLNTDPSHILFLSDCPNELAAAHAAQLHVCQIERAGQNTNQNPWPVVSDFYQVQPLFLSSKD